ncbi:MAG: type VI secretion system Vgr family protein [Rhodothalassiaceae bacterium]
MARINGMDISIDIPGHNGAPFQVAACRGEEAISRPYRFVLDLICEDDRLDLRALLFRAAELTLSGPMSRRTVHAVVTHLAQGRGTTTGRGHYVATLEPVLAKLELSRQNQIYGTDEQVSVVDVVTAELTGTGARGPAVQAAARLDVDCLRTDSLTGDYPKRDYIVQYEETDLAFISRLMEHWGIFYFFSDDGETERLHLGDRNVAFQPIDPAGSELWDQPRDANRSGTGARMPELPFQAGNGMNADGQDHVFALTAEAVPLPHKIILRDYNDQLPQLPALHAEAVVDEAGHGVVASYGEHFETPEEGELLARVRAEELKCRALRFEMHTNCPRLSAGRLFRLSGHEREDFNQVYIVAEVIHEAALPRGDGGAGDTPAPGYRNRIIALPFDMLDKADFRPERRTPVPRVHGLMTAHIDAAGLGEQAELDGQGRYKVRIPFDMTGAEDGKASRFIRKAQPYAGKNSGMHFPLLKGTEVAIACYNGDPNRPLITGAVPNPITRSPANADSCDKNRIVTRSNIVLEMSDGKASRQAAGQGHLAGPQAAPKQAAYADQGHHAPLDGLSTVQEEDRDGDQDVWLRLDVPTSRTADKRHAPRHYLRLGQAPDAVEEELLPLPEDAGGPDRTIKNPEGWFQYTSGDRTSVNIGDENIYGIGTTHNRTNQKIENHGTQTIVNHAAVCVSQLYYREHTAMALEAVGVHAGVYGANVDLILGTSISVILGTSISYAVTEWKHVVKNLRATGAEHSKAALSTSEAAVNTTSTAIDKSNAALSLDKRAVAMERRMTCYNATELGIDQLQVAVQNANMTLIG